MSEATARDLAVRCASAADANAIGQLLHDFNREYDEATPGPSVLAERIRLLIDADDNSRPAWPRTGACTYAGGDRTGQTPWRGSHGSGEDDAAARVLYESLGFTNHEGGPDGPVNYFYERGL